MSKYIDKKHLKVGLVFLFSIGLALLPVAVFAAPQFLVSWQAQSYVPSWYQGKIMPTKGSLITVGFELVDGGRIADLSGTVVRWYVNDKLILNEKNGLGIKSFSFNTPDYGGQQTDVRISLPNYRGQVLDDVITIPVVNPEVVIDGRSVQNHLQIGDNSFAATPFFFNTQSLSDLDFNWVANGQQANSQSDAPWMLNLHLDPNTQPGFSVNLGVTAQSLVNQLEFATKSIKLQVGK